jgi:diguanylate cyclase (GGDEF)-like protein/PAS domain S-box-containing protein
MLPWLLVLAAMLLLTAGDLISLVMITQDGPVTPFPSAADAFYLATYVALATGLFLLPRPAGVRGQTGVVDALVLTAGVGLLAWIFLVSPALDADVQTDVRVAAIVYPLFDVLLLAVAARVLISVRPSPALVLMIVGGASLLATDVIYALSLIEDTTRLGRGVDVGWMIFYVAWGTAALLPSMTTITEVEARRRGDVTRVRLIVLTASALIPPVVLFVQAAWGLRVDGLPIAILSATVFLLVLLRLAGVVSKLRYAGARERTLREAGAALVSATDVPTVGRVVREAIARLFRAGDTFEVALPLRTGTATDEPVPIEVQEAVLQDPASTRMVRTPSIAAVDADHLRTHGAALVIPMVVTERPAGDPLIGNLVVAADERKLTALKRTLEVLAAQAALAIERITLTAEVARNDTELYFRTLVQNTADVILIVNNDSTIRYASPSAATVLGDQDLIGRRITDLVIPEQRVRAEGGLSQVQAGIDPPGLAFWSTERPDGTLVEVEVHFRDLRTEPTVNGIVFTIRDVTEQRRLNRELQRLAYHDSLTGLPNRVQFTDQVRTALAQARSDQAVVGVLFLDLDDFKMVNDSLGHEIGDQLLQVVARRLSDAVAGDAVPARLGGDEFAVLVGQARAVSDVEQIADRVVAALAEPVVLGGSMLSASASVGVATTQEEATNNDLLRKADMALYTAKAAGKGQWRRYQPGLHATMVKKVALRSALERAVNRREFALVYQPIVRLADSAPMGLEALLRWADPQRGMVPPSEFIDVAEESGLIVPIGNWALERALADAAEWSAQETSSAPYLSLNISVRQFHSSGFLATVRRELRNSGLPPHRLLLEITESLLLRDDERVWGDLTRLRDLGIRVAIDDFGTGYSSLSYLRQVAIDVLKIDKTFIDAMASSKQQLALVDTIVRLAQTLGLDVVAEGVSRAEDRDLLVNMGCPYGQGYLFSRPMSFEAATRWLVGQRAGQRA